MPKVSVCLPVYNGERFLAQAIESVLNQQYKDFELLIVDDKSTDGSLDIANTYAIKDGRVRVKRNRTNVGLFANYNKCMDMALGEYVKLFAQDDLLHPTMLRTQVEALTSLPNVKLVSSAKRWIGPDGNELRVLRPFPESRTVSGRDVIRYNLLQLTNWVGEPSTVMFRSADKGDGFDTRFYHFGDIEYWFRIVESGEFRYIDDVLCSFRRHENSKTTGNLSGMFFALDMLLIGKKYKSYSKEVGETEEHFTRRAMELAARQLDQLQKEGLTIEEALAAQGGNGHSVEEQVAAFKELSYHSLRYMSKLLGDCHSLRCTVTDLVETVDDVRKNPLWRLTSPLRRISSNQVPGVDPSPPRVSSGVPASPEVYHRQGT